MLTRIVIFGHSHQPCLITLGHMLFFNPGSAGKKRFSLTRAARFETSPPLLTRRRCHARNVPNPLVFGALEQQSSRIGVD
jgi:hypothetical protein